MDKLREDEIRERLYDIALEFNYPALAGAAQRGDFESIIERLSKNKKLVPIAERLLDGVPGSERALETIKKYKRAGSQVLQPVLYYIGKAFIECPENISCVAEALDQDELHLLPGKYEGSVLWSVMDDLGRLAYQTHDPENVRKYAKECLGFD